MRKKKKIGLEEMTLKDFIAIFAMQAQIGHPDVMIAIHENKITPKEICGSCYEWANEMMEARNGN
jgi:hypothetical protein